jgi:hemerythrin-like domain-containing protein
MSTVHQAFSQQHADMRLYRVVHEAFRLATTRLVDATEELEPSALRPIIGPRWGFYAAILHHHHRHEDHRVFPALLAVRPEMATLIDRLADDHVQLVRAMDAVDAAVTMFGDHPDAAHQKAVHDALIAVRDSFFPHLDVEDADVIPACATSFSPMEWDRIDQEALKSIPRHHQATAAGALDEVIRRLPQQERPPSPPPPIRLMLALWWRRKWAAWSKPLLVR